MTFRVALLALAAGAACASVPLAVSSPATNISQLKAIGPGDVLLAGAGDIAECGEQLNAARGTAALLDQLPNAVIFTAGDNAYPLGTPHDYTACYDPTWGRFRARTFPSPGNHDGPEYFHYFPNAKGHWYSYDRGAWHIVSLDSDAEVGPQSPQVEWLESDLAANRQQCIAAYWHHPLFSSALHGWQPGDRGHSMGTLWTVLLRHHADVVINGHDHDYERFGPQRRDGIGEANGIREFVAGTGGAKLRGFVVRKRNSERRINAHGVLVLTLHPGSYEWHFVGIDGRVLDESATAQKCHGAS